MTDQEAISIVVSLHAGRDPYVIRPVVERLEHLLPDVAWSDLVAQHGDPQMAPLADLARLRRFRDDIVAAMAEWGFTGVWFSSERRVLLVREPPATYDYVQLFEVERVIAGIVGRGVEVLTPGVAAFGEYIRGAVEL